MSKVYIVGAGPGDKSLLTYGAYQHLQNADIVLYDALVSKEILDLIPQQTKTIYVGKRATKHSISQHDIGKLILDATQKYKYIVRLKGGDSTIYARLAEEIFILEKHHISYKILAGVTSFSGAAASLRVPLTDRNCGSEFLIVTAKTFESQESCKHLVYFLNQGCGASIYMPLHQNRDISKSLLQNGAKPDLPFLFIVSATTNQQKTMRTTLKNITWKILKSFANGEPSIILLGKPFSNIHLTSD